MDNAGGRTGQRVRYAFDLPTDLSGTVQMRISEMGLPAVLFPIAAPLPEAAESCGGKSSSPSRLRYCIFVLRSCS